MTFSYRTERNAKAISAYWNKPIDDKPCYKITGNSTEPIQSRSDTTEICIFDVLGYPFNDINQIVKDVDAVKTRNILVRINSPGGDAIDTLSLVQALKRHPAKVTVRIEALAASAASVLAMAGDIVEAYDTSLMMIHNAWLHIAGNKQDLIETASILSKVDSSLLLVYAQKTGKPIHTIENIMDAETWFTAYEAKEHGFVDVVLSGAQQKAQSSFSQNSFNHSVYADTIPERLRAQYDKLKAINQTREQDERGLKQALEKLYNTIKGL